VEREEGRGVDRVVWGSYGVGGGGMEWVERTGGGVGRGGQKGWG